MDTPRSGATLPLGRMAPTRKTPSSKRIVVVGACGVELVVGDVPPLPVHAATCNATSATSVPLTATRRYGTVRVYEMAAS
jgi:hypothetical protein